MKANHKYSWSRHFGVPAQVFGDFYYGLERRTPEELIKAARNVRSPVHQLFEWNDKKAADAQRLIHARVMINSLHVDIITPKGKKCSVMAFIQSSDRGRHVATVEATRDEITGMMKRFWRDILRIRAQYRNLEIASTVVSAIDEVDRVLRRKRAA